MGPCGNSSQNLSSQELKVRETFKNELASGHVTLCLKLAICDLGTCWPSDSYVDGYVLNLVSLPGLLLHPYNPWLSSLLTTFPPGQPLGASGVSVRPMKTLWPANIQDEDITDIYQPVSVC